QSFATLRSQTEIGNESKRMSLIVVCLSVPNRFVPDFARHISKNDRSASRRIEGDVYSHFSLRQSNRSRIPQIGTEHIQNFVMKLSCSGIDLRQHRLKTGLSDCSVTSSKDRVELNARWGTAWLRGSQEQPQIDGRRDGIEPG